MNTLSSLLLFIGQKLTGLQQQIYPVGSIYICTHTTNPASLFGGSWQKIEGRFLLASSAAYALNSTGGSANAVVPYHRHYIAEQTITGGAHAHDMGNRWSSGSGSETAYKRDSNRNRTTINTGSSASHSHTLAAHYSNYEGTSGNATGANMPPYLAVNVWQRIA